jgi:hypothetical protein
MFRAATRIFVGLLIGAIAVYGFNCVGVITPAQAMQCCKTMRCMSSHRVGQDCCKTMPTSQVVIGQPTSMSLEFAQVADCSVPTVGDPLSIAPLARIIPDQSHAPPTLTSAVLPLRI